MEWITLFVGIAALAIASDSEAKAARLAKRVASLEDLCTKRQSGGDAG